MFKKMTDEEKIEKSKEIKDFLLKENWVVKSTSSRDWSWGEIKSSLPVEYYTKYKKDGVPLEIGLMENGRSNNVTFYPIYKEGDQGYDDNYVDFGVAESYYVRYFKDFTDFITLYHRYLSGECNIQLKFKSREEINNLKDSLLERYSLKVSDELNSDTFTINSINDDTSGRVSFDCNTKEFRFIFNINTLVVESELFNMIDKLKDLKLREWSLYKEDIEEKIEE